MGGDRERFVFLPTSVGEIWWVVWNNMGQPPCWEPPLTDTSVMTQWRLLKTTQIPTDDVTPADAAMSDQTSAMSKKQNGIMAMLKNTSRFSIWPKKCANCQKLDLYIYIFYMAHVWIAFFRTCVPNTKVYFCTSDRHGPHVMSQPLLVICEFFPAWTSKCKDQWMTQWPDYTRRVCNLIIFWRCWYHMHLALPRTTLQHHNKLSKTTECLRCSRS